jgi:phage major head subunit gpT-like protein
MANQNYSAKAEALFLTFDKRFQQGYDMAPSFVDQIASTIPSTTRESRYVWMDRIPALREWIGPREIQSLTSQAYSLPNKKYERTVPLDLDDLEDDQIQVFAGVPEELGIEAKIWPDRLLAEAVEAGESALSFDSAAFFSTSHPIDTTGVITTNTQSNLYTSAALAAPTLSEGRKRLKSMKGRDGNPLGVGSRGKLLLMVPNALESTAMALANSEMIAPSLTFAGNAAGGYQSNVLRGSFDVLVNPYLTDDTAWYLMDTSRPIKPFIWQLRKAPKFTWKNRPEDDNVFFTNQALYGVDARGAAGYGLYFLCLKGKP